MGLITQEVEQKLIRMKGVLSAKMPLVAPVSGLIAPPMGGPVQGVLLIDVNHLYNQLDAVEECLESVVKALKKLEERK